MYYLKVASLIAWATLASALNTVTFQSTDDVDRTVHWTPSIGSSSIKDTIVPGGKNVTAEVPTGWIGNFYAVCDGAEDTPGMLGEVSFNSWADLTYFDVSAIVNSADHNGVAMMYPSDEPWTPTSGCAIFPCANAYYVWDDVQTKATTSTSLITTLGTSSKVGTRSDIDEREDNSESFPRDAVTTRMWRPKRS